MASFEIPKKCPLNSQMAARPFEFIIPPGIATIRYSFIKGDVPLVTTGQLFMIKPTSIVDSNTFSYISGYIAIYFLGLIWVTLLCKIRFIKNRWAHLFEQSDITRGSNGNTGPAFYQLTNTVLSWSITNKSCKCSRTLTFLLVFIKFPHLHCESFFFFKKVWRKMRVWIEFPSQDPNLRHTAII